MEILGGTAVAIGGTLDLVLQARELAGPRPLLGVLATLLGAPPGRVWLIRAGLLLALTAVWARGARGAPTGAGRRWMRLGLAAAVVMTGGLVSHVAATSRDAGCSSASRRSTFWPWPRGSGGVLGFATVFWRAGAGSLPAREAARLALALPAFSGLAVLAVGALAVSGLVLARLHLAAWDELVGTPYGRWLAAKVVVFLAMLGLGAWHQGWIQPSLLRAIQRGDAAVGSVPRFRRSIRVEAALGLVALALAGILGVTAPPAPSSTRRLTGCRPPPSVTSDRSRRPASGSRSHPSGPARTRSA